MFPKLCIISLEYVFHIYMCVCVCMYIYIVHVCVYACILCLTKNTYTRIEDVYKLIFYSLLNVYYNKRHPCTSNLHSKLGLRNTTHTRWNA